MLDIKLIREQTDAVKRGLAARNVDTAVIDEVLRLDTSWRELKAQEEAQQAALNKANKAFGPWMGARKKDPKAPAPAELTQLLGAAPADPEAAKAALGKLGEKRAEIAARADRLMAEIEQKLLFVPNLPVPQTPVGKSEADNVVRKTWGAAPKFDFTPKPHWELADLGNEIGGRISGSGFPFFRGRLARLERALINFFLDLHTREHGYTECWAPFLVREETLRNSGQLPKFAEEMYRTDARDDLYLIPTAEVPLTSVHADSIIADEQTPIRYCAFTPCFRREAGAAGKDTRGILRVHQFSKVELMVVTTPEQSEAEHETLTRCAETVLERLEIPYRRLELCTADIGFGAARCYDLEVWAAGVGKWLEASSCSTFTDYQARRARIRVKDKDRGARLAHTLNGSGLACPRTMIAILENNQTAEGKVRIPDALRPFYGAEWL
ncbi:MAG: serine--tRNA ligase [Planctomycetes bacterium]|jgi:seryl-tRNA synthetase|nr:serine--tRNA ligase [Planctomycetota bacterium]MCL4731314.1 serine--tRNA ligase [Planctomycetota bacterium]